VRANLLLEGVAFVKGNVPEARVLLANPPPAPRDDPSAREPPEIKQPRKPQHSQPQFRRPSVVRLQLSAAGQS
jgi:hypothetical protein